MITRRRLLKTLPALAALPGLAMEAQWSGESFTSHFHKKPLAPPQPTLVYFGTDTAKGVSKGIYVSRFDSATGQLTAPVLAAAGVRPGFLALSESVVGHPRLYVTNEALDASATISSFAVDLGTGALRPINQVSSGAPGPCFVSLDATGEMAFAADYAGRRDCVLPRAGRWLIERAGRAHRL